MLTYVPAPDPRVRGRIEPEMHTCLDQDKEKPPLGHWRPLFTRHAEGMDVLRYGIRATIVEHKLQVLRVYIACCDRCGEIRAARVQE